MIETLKKQYKHHHLILAGILLLTFILRFPSLFEPFWYGDEGIFAAVGRNLNLGGTLYATAWDNKPPMIYLTYAAIFKFFGVSMFWLHLTGAVVVLATAVVIYEIALEILGEKRALVATAVFGFLTSLRLLEGNLALTEIFMILPISAAMLIAVKRKFDFISLFAAGFLFAIASLYKQVGAFEAAALGIFLFLYLKSLKDFIFRGIILSIGFAVPYVPTILYFYSKHLLSDYIFAAYTYYRIYLGESPKYAQLITILKFTPLVAAVIYGVYKKIKSKDVDLGYLFLLWAAFSFLGSYFSGRTYGHYLVQATPSVSLLAASVSLKFKLNIKQIVFGLFFFVPIVYLTSSIFSNFISAGPINQISYYQNFLDFADGKKSTDSYNSYFDSNVNRILALNSFLTAVGARGKNVYIWGDIAWLYAISDLQDPVRYVTSFHVFGVPNGKEEVMGKLIENLPVYILKPPSSIGNFAELEKFLKGNYTLLLRLEDVDIWQR